MWETLHGKDGKLTVLRVRYGIYSLLRSTSRYLIYPNAVLRVDAVNCHELKDAEQQQQRSRREVEHLQTQLSAATADAWTIRMVEHAASRHGVAHILTC